MKCKIGILLPRSTDYPQLGFDLLDGIKCNLKAGTEVETTFVMENIGYGENRKDNYAKAEKMILQDEVDLIIAYLSGGNAEAMYALSVSLKTPFLFLDPGMSHPAFPVAPGVASISLQGLLASFLLGKQAGEGGAEVLMATSFYDGGYRGPWAYARGIEAAGGKIAANYVSHYKESEFTAQPFVKQLQENQTKRVAACFSTYLSGLFINHLHKETALPEADYYCSSFMAEEQLLAAYSLPPGNFFSYVPWASSLESPSNKAFTAYISEKKNKQANVFHLLGWEAGIVVKELLNRKQQQSLYDAMTQLTDFSYESPRGTVHLHPHTRSTYAPLYAARLLKNESGTCALKIEEEIAVSGQDHLQILTEEPIGPISGWLNNYLCS